MVSGNFLLFFYEAPHFINFDWGKFKLCDEVFVKLFAVLCNNACYSPNGVKMMAGNSCNSTKAILFRERCLQIVVISLFFKCLWKNGVLIVRIKFLLQSEHLYF